MARKPSFEIDPRITVKLDFNLAAELAELLEAAKSENPAIFALMMQLKNLVEKEG